MQVTEIGKDKDFPKMSIAEKGALMCKEYYHHHFILIQKVCWK
jgi:hypothetical protein